MFTKARSTLAKSQERDLSRRKTERSTLEKLKTARDTDGARSQTQQLEDGARAVGSMVTLVIRMGIST